MLIIVIFYYLCVRLRCLRWHQSPRMKREHRCKSETIPVAVSFITLRAFSMVTARRVGRPHGGNKSEDLPLSVFRCFREIERQRLSRQKIDFICNIPRKYHRRVIYKLMHYDTDSSKERWSHCRF